MVRWSHVAWLCLFVGGGVAACNKTCVDDGLHSNQDPAACMAATTTATSTSDTAATYATTATTYGADTTTTTTGDSDSDSDGTTLGLTSAPDTSTTTTTDTSTGTSDNTSTGTSSNTTGGQLVDCNDGFPGPGETGTDCGGQCVLEGKKCANLSPCEDDVDCQSGACHPMGVCVEPLCNNGLFDQGIEAHVDCGSSCGPLCGLGIPCDDPDDCAPGLGCYGGHCAMNGQCGNGEQTADETDLDCGGPLCGPSCRQFQMCDVGADCITNSCIDSVCDDPLCQDNLLNHGETDTDCGGPCAPCFGGLKCVADSDCFSYKCNFFSCG